MTSKENITHAFKIGLRTVTEEQKTKLRILRTGKKFTKEQREKFWQFKKEFWSDRSCEMHKNKRRKKVKNFGKCK